MRVDETITINLTELLLQCVVQLGPMLSMLEWLCNQLMEAAVNQQQGQRKVNELKAVEVDIAVATDFVA